MIVNNEQHCRYFVLDLEHDPFAVPALKAYAEACRGTHPGLAHDLDYVCAGTPDEDGQTISNSPATRLDVKMRATQTTTTEIAEGGSDE